MAGGSYLLGESDIEEMRGLTHDLKSYLACVSQYVWSPVQKKNIKRKIHGIYV